jgi:hypothetical protein
LDSDESGSEAQSEVERLMLREWLQHRQSEAGRLGGDCQLGDVALVVRVVDGHDRSVADKMLRLKT